MPVPTKQTVRAEIDARHGKIDGLRVRYRRAAPGSDGHHVVAELWFLGTDHLLVDGGHGWSEISWQKYYGRSRSHIRGSLFEVDWPNKLAWEVIELKDQARIQRVHIQTWLRASGYWPEGSRLRRPEMFGVPLSLRAVLADDKYSIEPEWVDQKGVRCLVLANGTADRLFLDPERGFALRRREVQTSGQLAMRVEVPALVEHEGDLFLPARYRIEVHKSAEGERLENVAEMDVTVEMTKVGGLVPADFMLEKRPGALRFDRWDASRFEQTEPGGLAFLKGEARRERLWVASQATPSRIPWWGLSLGAVLLWLVAWVVGARSSQGTGSLGQRQVEPVEGSA